MSRHRSLRNKTATVALAVGLTTLLVAPALSSANLVNDLVGKLSTAVSGGSTPSASPRSGSGATYVPPLKGGNPHGQGTVGDVELTPNNTLPQPYLPGGNPLETLAGSSRGEQQADGTYHGHITILSLLGTELLGVNTTEGQTAHGPLNPAQTAILDAICTGSGNAICLGVLRSDSETSGAGGNGCTVSEDPIADPNPATTPGPCSENHFDVADVALNLGGNPITATVASSNGDISSDGTCQTAHGDSSVADANVLNALTADAIGGTSDSQACNDGTPSSASGSSNVVNLNGTGLGIPVQGCADGTPNSSFTTLVPLVSAVCNADDTNNGQTSDPYNVREGLTVFVLNVLGGNPLAKATTAGPESHAVAPPNGGPTCETDPSLCPTGPTGPTGGEGNTPEGPAAGNAGPNNNGTLPFTGANVLLIAMLGLGLVGGGLALKAALDGRTRSGA